MPAGAAADQRLGVMLESGETAEAEMGVLETTLPQQSLEHLILGAEAGVALREASVTQEREVVRAL